MTQLDSITIKAARIDRGYTQEGLAALLGVSKRTIGTWENNRMNIPKHILLSLAYLYEMEVEQLRVEE